jgi:ankyrin repeat protein
LFIQYLSKIFDSVIQKDTIKEKTKSGKVPLHFCVEGGNLSCLEAVLGAEPALINARDEEGYTPIHLAVINGNKDAVKALIAGGADTNCLDNERHSLVHWATGKKSSHS